MVTNVYAKFPYGPLRIKKALGIFEKGNNNPKNNNNRRSELGPFLGPKTHFESAIKSRAKLQRWRKQKQQKQQYIRFHSPGAASIELTFTFVCFLFVRLYFWHLVAS